MKKVKRVDIGIKKKIKIVFIIRQFNTGGAQKQLIYLASSLNKDYFDPYVLSYYSGGIQENDIINSGVKYISLNKKGKFEYFFIFKLLKIVNKINPDILYTFL